MSTVDSASPSRKRPRVCEFGVEKDVKESLPNLSEEEDVEAGPASWAQTRIESPVQKHTKWISQLYAPFSEAKIWGVASRYLASREPLRFFPEYTKPGGVDYVYRELDFWTSGFFPGSIHLLLERRTKLNWRGGRSGADGVDCVSESQLEHACKVWTDSLHQNAHLTTTHDLGFMIMPWAKIAYELKHDLRAFETIKTAAESLFSRFDKSMGCIRSWDKCVTKKYNFNDPEQDYMVIIDNMMNLNLLFYAASKTGNVNMFDAAIEHARTTTRTHIRPDGSTTHLIVLDPQSGNVKQRLTNQGYSHTSCWARGQAWGIAGFAETYTWTHDIAFLITARRCADYFLQRLPESGIVPWDFDALEIEDSPQPPDVSAAVIAAYGMLLIHQALTALQQNSTYLEAALSIMKSVCENHINVKAEFSTVTRSIDTVEHGLVEVPMITVDIGLGDTILNGATINNYEFAPRRWANHGLVYADYYFLLFGNKLLEMGLSPSS